MNTIKIILISFFSGLLGAYTWSFYDVKEEQEKEKPSFLSDSKARLPQVHSVNTSPSSSQQVPFDFSDAASAALYSIVYINSISKGAHSYSYWDWLFGREQQTKISSGSGVIYSSDGYIITNNHVISAAESIQVIYQKRSYEAELIGTDPSTDLAVLKIDGKNLPPLKIGSSKNLEVGDWVIAVGNPFSLSSTVTAGIVSAKGRRLNIVRDKFPIESFIQTDAAINPGNSGGALINSAGELVGINTAILSQTGSYTGYAFAVPIDIAHKVANDLIRYGLLQKGFFGGLVVDNDFQNAEKFDFTDTNFKGVIISSIDREGAARKAGLREMDIITHVNNQSINSESEFEEELSYYSPGDKIEITFERNNEVLSCTLTLLNRYGKTDLLKRKIYQDAKLGASLEAVDYGVKVFKIQHGIFHQLGIRENFIIISINRKLIKDPEQVIDFFESYSGRGILYGLDSDQREKTLQFYIR